MDISKIKKLAEENIKADELMKAVTEVKNEIKNREQTRDAVMSDHFKTLREPLLLSNRKKQMKNRIK